MSPKSSRSHAPLRSFRRFFRSFRKDRSGVTAVEFAIIAAPFLALLFSIMEVGLVFFGNLQLENAAEEAARLIRTGQAQEKGFSKEDFKNEICSRVVGLFDCKAGLKVEVKTYNSFGGINPESPIDGDGNVKNDFTFDMGDAEDIVLVRVFYEWDFTAKIPGVGLANMDNGNRLLQAATTFRNEPFGG